MIIRVNRRLAPQLCAGNLAASVRNHLVYIHVELRSAARHPYMQRKHVVVLPCENFVADLNDQIMALLVEAFSREIGVCGSFFQNGIGRDHFAGDQVLSYAEMFERALRLCAPKLVGRNVHLPEAVRFLAYLCHFIFPFSGTPFAIPLARQLASYMRPVRRWVEWDSADFTESYAAPLFVAILDVGW
jgi:hypothetical protein